MCGVGDGRWLHADLWRAQHNRRTVPWVIVLAERPLYCSSASPADCVLWTTRARAMLEPLLTR
jgi:hypothetical protein